jgi:hypothetical protein
MTGIQNAIHSQKALQIHRIGHENVHKIFIIQIDFSATITGDIFMLEKQVVQNMELVILVHILRH